MSTVAHPRVFVISGPSGVGKSTVIQGAMNAIPELRLSVSYTTRESREMEEEGRDYFFVGREEFERRIAADEFLEWAQVFDEYYGTSRLHVEEIVRGGSHALLDVDTKGAMHIMELCDGAVYIFITPPSLEDLEQRLRARGTETEETLAKRLARAESEISFAPRYDYKVVNDDADQAIQDFVGLIREEAARAVPFAYKSHPADGGAVLAADQAEALVREFTGRVGPGLRDQLVELINHRVQTVLTRDLDGLILESLRKYTKQS